jgi:hypothetical protein
VELVVDNDKPPDFIEPQRFSQFTEDQQRDFLEQLRARRLIAVHYYERIKEERAANKRAELDRKFGVLEGKVKRCIEKIDDELVKVEAHFAKLAHLQLEAM